MIARFGFGNKRSPTNEPRTSESQVPRISQRLPHQNASNTSTHFFSLHNWRRRNPRSEPSTPPHQINPIVDEHGLPARRSSYNVLSHSSLSSPSSEEVPSRRSVPWPPAYGNDDGRPHLGQPAQSDEASPRPSIARTPAKDSVSQPTAALARAALNLGLPHGMSALATSSSAAEMSSAAFLSDSLQYHRPRPSDPVLRKAKSFHKLLPDPFEDVSEFGEHQRQRSVSLVPVPIPIESKGKEREHRPDNGTASQQKTVSRKSSFWRRKDSLKVATADLSKLSPSHPGASRDNTFTPDSSIPSLRPMSPFNMDTFTPLTHLSTSSGSPGLHRRHSDRVRSVIRRASSPTLPFDTSPTATGTTRQRKSSRPATADQASSSGSHSSGLTPPSFSSPSPSALTPKKSEALSQDKTKMRPRAQTNPPLLHRLSMNLFSSSLSTPVPPPVPSLSPAPTVISPAPSSSSSPRVSTSKSSVEIPKPLLSEESPEDYVRRLVDVVNKADVASALAISGDKFYAQALRAYISRFDFSRDPLDVALRKLLMHVGLPRETQQIDRVIEAFAYQYSQCNPGLFARDHTYILAFSLIMLHTDAFNKSNKHKMTKTDYIRNTTLPGISTEVLDCFYDNIVFAPFIFIEDSGDGSKERISKPDGDTARRMSSLSPMSVNSSGNTLLGKNTRIDPYDLITRHALDPLRVDVGQLDSWDGPYSCNIPGGLYSIEDIHNKFIDAASAEVGMENNFGSPAFFSIPSPMLAGSPMGMSPDVSIGPNIHPVRIVKYGLLGRKDDIVEGGKRALSRKWKEWSVILTGSQLLLYRDPAWIPTLVTKLRASAECLVPQRVTLPRPDESMVLVDSIAVHDISYTKKEHTFRFAIPEGRQTLFQTSDAREMYNWIACINYASAFKTANIRIRSSGLSKRDIELTGVAAATSHLREIELRNRASSQLPAHTWGTNGSTSSNRRKPSRVESFMFPGDGRRSRSIDFPESSSSRSEGSSPPVKATFDEVKANLATDSRWPSVDLQQTSPRALSLDLSSMHLSTSASHSAHSEPISRQSPRAMAIRRKILELDSKVIDGRSQIDSHLRRMRNIAVLTPFQRATRDRLQVAVNNIAKVILQMQLDVTKLVCYRDILTNDLAAAESQLRHMKEVALNAAKEVLLSRTGLIADSNTFGDGRESPPIARRKPTSLDDSSRSDSRSNKLRGLIMARSPASLHLNRTSLDTPVTEASSSVGSFPIHLDEDSGQSSASAEPKDGQVVQLTPFHERYYTAPEIVEEEAEEWNKTKAAKRVSLVRLPTDLKMSMLIKPVREDVTLESFR